MKKTIVLVFSFFVLLFCVSCKETPKKPVSPSATPSPEITSTPTPSPTEAPTADMLDIPSTELVKLLGAGFNIGNSLDASGSKLSAETAWGNPKTTKELVKALKDAGFNTIRVPVSWANHFGIFPDFTIDAEWLARVKEVVDYAIDLDLYVILDMHHEQSAWLKVTEKDYPGVRVKFMALWKQIALTFKDYDEHLIFEACNEPRTIGSAAEWNGGTREEREVINKLHADFYNTVRETGGNNSIRHLMFQTYGGSTNTNALAQWINPNPEDKHIIASVHAYTPYDFALNIKGGNHFNSSETASKRDIDYLKTILKQYFIDKGIPVILGECGSVNKNNLEDRVDHISYFFKTLNSIGVPCVWWDNGCVTGDGELFGIIDRNTYEWIFPELRDAMINAIK